MYWQKKHPSLRGAQKRPKEVQLESKNPSKNGMGIVENDGHVLRSAALLEYYIASVSALCSFSGS